MAENDTTLYNQSIRQQPNVTGPRFPSDHFLGTVVLFKFLFAIIDGFGIVGNIVVISTIIFNRNMRSSIHYLLANLAFSDLLFATLVPFHITMLVKNYKWSFGAIFCRAYYFLLRSFYNFSIINLMLITVERFLAARYPLLFHNNPKRTVAFILANWVLSFVISYPFLSVMKHKTIGRNSYCIQSWPDKTRQMSYYTFIYVGLYLLPFSLIAFTYAHICVALRKRPIGDINDTQRRHLATRRRMSLLVATIVVTFFICWTPWNIIEFIEQIHEEWNDPDILPTMKHYAMLATIVSAAANPALFSLMSSEFREGVRLLIKAYMFRRSSVIDVNVPVNDELHEGKEDDENCEPRNGESQV